MAPGHQLLGKKRRGRVWIEMTSTAITSSLHRQMRKARLGASVEIWGSREQLEKTPRARGSGPACRRQRCGWPPPSADQLCCPGMTSCSLTKNMPCSLCLIIVVVLGYLLSYIGTVK